MSTVPTDSPRRSAVYRTILATAIVLSLFVVFAGCVSGIIRMRNAAARMTTSSKLKQLGVAIHSYHDVTGSLPGPNALYTDEKGRVSKYPVSWRVLILPYIEEGKLFKQYRFDEPWDGPNNIELLKRMPRSYRHPKADDAEQSAGLTHFRVFASRPGLKPSALFTDGLPGPKLSEIPDGSSSTIMIVEAEEAVPWTMPEALLYDPDQPLAKLGGCSKGSFKWPWRMVPSARFAPIRRTKSCVLGSPRTAANRWTTSDSSAIAEPDRLTARIDR